MADTTREALRALIRAYVNLLETGRDRIVSLGGQCDPVDVMEASDPHLRAARAALATPEQAPAVQAGALDQLVDDLVEACVSTGSRYSHAADAARLALDAAIAALATTPAAQAEQPAEPGWYVVRAEHLDGPAVRAFGRDELWWIPLGKGNGDDGWMTAQPYAQWWGPIAPIDDPQPFRAAPRGQAEDALKQAMLYLTLTDAMGYEAGSQCLSPEEFAERLRADAARYRWLRSTTNYATSNGERIDVRNMPEVWDAAIDACIARASDARKDGAA